MNFAPVFNCQLHFATVFSKHSFLLFERLLEKLTGNNSLYTGILETGEVFFPLFKRIHRINVDQLKGFVEVAKQFLCITRFIFQPPLFSCFLLSLFLSQFSSFKVPI